MYVTEILDKMSKTLPPVPAIHDLQAVFAHRLAIIESRLSAEEFSSFIEIGAAIEQQPPLAHVGGMLKIGYGPPPTSEKSTAFRRIKIQSNRSPSLEKPALKSRLV